MKSGLCELGNPRACPGQGCGAAFFCKLAWSRWSKEHGWEVETRYFENICRRTEPVSTSWVRSARSLDSTDRDFRQDLRRNIGAGDA